MRHVNHATLAGCLLLVVSSFGAVPASGNTSSNGTKRPAAKPDAGAKK
jgi:hypothetical protein